VGASLDRSLPVVKVRHGDQREASRREHPAQLRQRDPWLPGVLEDVAHGDQVEGSVLERKGLKGSLPDIEATRLGRLHGVPGHVGPCAPHPEAPTGLDHEADGTADVEIALDLTEARGAEDLPARLADPVLPALPPFARVVRALVERVPRMRVDGDEGAEDAPAAPTPIEAERLEV